MAYTPHTDRDVREMLDAVGASTLDDLYADIPEALRLKAPVDVPTLDEYELAKYFEDAAAENRVVPAGRLFLGAGAYQHYIPAAVKNLISRGEVVTCYTPYQAEVSQGTLQAIFEFQSHICALTGMEVANASMYDGGSALAEACLMAVRHNGGNVVLIPEAAHPNYRKVVETHMREVGVKVKVLPLANGRTRFLVDLEDGEKVAAVAVQTPNFFGILEDGSEARALADKLGALLIASCNPMALALIAPPGEFGADIAVGEAQPVGIPLQYGGPYCGFFATKNALMRKMPGRISGLTTDAAGREGYTLTLQTREQHIRREKATSNICTNQGLFALMVTMYLTFVGKNGLIEVAETCVARAHRLVEGLIDAGAQPLFANQPFFHEAALRLPMPAREFRAAMRARGFVAGTGITRWWKQHDNVVLICATECNSDADIDGFLAAAREVLQGVASAVWSVD